MSELFFGAPLSPNALKVMLLGSGELGKSSSPCNAWAWKPSPWTATPTPRLCQVAHRSHVLAMTDAAALRALVENERPHLIVPEIKATSPPMSWRASKPTAPG